MSIAMSAAEHPTQNGTPRAKQAGPATREFFGNNGRLRVEGLSDVDRNYAVLIHLSPLAAIIFPIAIVAPLVLWLVRKDHLAFIDDHGKEVVNFLISFVVLHVILALACLTIIGIPLALVGIPALWIAWIIGMIRGAIAAGKGEYFRYPMTIRFLA